MMAHRRLPLANCISLVEHQIEELTIDCRQSNMNILYRILLVKYQTGKMAMDYRSSTMDYFTFFAIIISLGDFFTW